MLLLAGLGVSGMVLFLLCTNVTAQYSALYAAQQTVHRQEISIEFPCSVKGTPLTAVQLACYEGPFWEDGSTDEVADIAALVIENSGDSFVTEGAVVLDWGEDRMVFELFCLPPGGKVLVLEKERKTYRSLEDFQCSGWVSEAAAVDTEAVTVTPAGAGSLVFTNQTGTVLSSVTAIYKHMDPESGMYIGGIAYRETVRELQPAQSRIVTPWCYSTGYSQVVRVVLDMAE